GRTLRDSGQRAETMEGLNQQREQLDDLLKRMQQTVEEAEHPEPALARQLYDTLRAADKNRTADALDVTKRLLEVGIGDEANKSMQNADTGITELRQGVERAAESVLLNETDVLRQAQREIDRLADELNREIQNALGEQGATSRDVTQQAGSQAGDQARNQQEDQAGERGRNQTGNQPGDQSAAGGGEQQQVGGQRGGNAGKQN